MARIPFGRPTRLMFRLAGHGGRNSVVGLWRPLEPIAMRLWRVRTMRPGGLLEFGVSPYRGPSTVLADGTRVRRGDRILHLHLDGHVLSHLAGARRMYRREVIELALNDLEALAEQVRSGRLGHVTALRGVSVLAPSARFVGFEVRPLPHTRRWALVRVMAALVLAAWHPYGVRELDRGLPWPGEIWMSSRTLLAGLHAAAQPLTD